MIERLHILPAACYDGRLRANPLGAALWVREMRGKGGSHCGQRLRANLSEGLRTLLGASDILRTKALRCFALALDFAQRFAAFRSSQAAAVPRAPA